MVKLDIFLQGTGDLSQTDMKWRVLAEASEVSGSHLLNRIIIRVVQQGCRFVPRNNPPQMVPTDLNIGFQGLALIQGQIYNPVQVSLFMQ